MSGCVGGDGIQQNSKTPIPDVTNQAVHWTAEPTRHILVALSPLRVHTIKILLTGLCIVEMYEYWINKEQRQVFFWHSDFDLIENCLYKKIL